MGDVILELKDADFSYPGHAALSGINLTVHSDDFLAIIGPNGGGKSTLLKLILGLLKPQKGDVLVDRDMIGYLPQFHGFTDHYPISVMDVVLMGALKKGFFHRFSQDERDKAMDLLKLVRADELADWPIDTLSGGQTQRVLLARALMRDPKLLILDEPTCSVDQPTGQHFFELMEELSKTMAIIMVSHDLMAVSHSAKSIALLNQTLTYHHTKNLDPSDIEKAYCCHVVLKEHHGHSH